MYAQPYTKKNVAGITPPTKKGGHSNFIWNPNELTRHCSIKAKGEGHTDNRPKMTVIITSTLRGGEQQRRISRETNHHWWGMRWQRPHKAIVEASYIYKGSA